MALNNGAARKPPRISTRSAKFATILVGYEGVPFVVHEELLTYHSPFFRAALTGGFEEAAKREVRLEEVDESIFEFFIHWLYHQRLPEENDDPELFAAWKCDTSSGGSKTSNLIRLNIFCEKYDVPALKCLSLDHLFERLTDPEVELPSYRDTLYAFANVPDDSPLCRLLVDFSCHYADEEFWTYVGGNRWVEFCGLVDEAVVRAFVMKILQRYTQYALGERGSFMDLDICDYHDHKGHEEEKACTAERVA